MQNFAYFQHVDSGSRQTLLVLQFVIEFANIWAHSSTFFICTPMSKWQPFNVYFCHCERDASCHMTSLAEIHTGTCADHW